MEDMEVKDEVSQEDFEENEVCEELPFKNSGMSTVEIILILVVLIALVIIFKSQITTLVNNIFQSINKSASKIY
jgi:Flp pilus assembly pilin Flp